MRNSTAALSPTTPSGYPTHIEINMNFSPPNFAWFSAVLGVSLVPLVSRADVGETAPFSGPVEGVEFKTESGLIIIDVKQVQLI